ncbi:MAG: 23S rRNA (adenine(2503)-C(2))-methyltransferase RlmN [Bacteroidales bacterium]|nr:23S rRNA (adenine(2503)-C(2))-methyltransferase RlmN [Bacteroidales bacterium]
MSTAFSNEKPALLGMTLEELTTVATDLGLPRFVGKQICGWIYDKHVRSIEEMTNLSKNARQLLAQHYQLGISTPVESVESRDGTIKYLYRTVRGQYIETVYIPDGERATLCVSSQVGCKMACAFCMTGRQGFMAHLSAADILNQIYSLPQREKLTNIVFMGQGEPMDNIDNVLRATAAMTASWGYAWSPKRITVSTVGLVKGLTRFLDESQCSLAISLHHPLAKERQQMMPAERAFSIEDMVNLLKQYDFARKTDEDYAEGAKQRRLTFEYIVFRGLNDSEAHADALVKLLAPLDCRINLIRFHHIPDTPFQGTDDAGMVRLRDYLTRKGITTTIRASRGQDIYAACGMLTTKKMMEERA